MHYYVWVLRNGPFPEHDADIDCMLDPLLAPYNMEKKGPESVAQCDCFTEKGRLMASIFGEGPSSPIDEPLGTPWGECPACQGAGSYVDQSNPVGWWDWWERGGRWAGMLDCCVSRVSNPCDEGQPGSLAGCDDRGALLRVAHVPLRDVAAADSVRDGVLSGYPQLPDAIVHPVSGKWIWSYEGGRPGHEDEDARPDWREQVWSALLQAQFVIVVDIHW
jgi:hypothetical protein